VAAALALKVGVVLLIDAPPPVHAIAIRTATESAATTPRERPRDRAV